MAAQFLKIYGNDPAPRHIQQRVECLKDGGVIVYPTDTIYGVGCDITQAKAVERVAAIKGVKLEKANFSFICHDLSHIADYTLPLNTSTFRLMRAALPGPFTFILPANGNVPKLFRNKKKTVGIRVPDNAVVRELVRALGNPILSSSAHLEDAEDEYTTNPELLYERYRHQVDLVIDGGVGGLVPSTIIDCTTEELSILRQGAGDFSQFV
jgi:tRNA threonylcarbamoyl adenosine modification protein (Sua5/YciO/YrdC/YwlC family)